MVIIISSPTIIKKEEKVNILVDVQRPYKKRLSRYKLKKQESVMQMILDDPQII